MQTSIYMAQINKKTSSMKKMNDSFVDSLKFQKSDKAISLLLDDSNF